MPSHVAHALRRGLRLTLVGLALVGLALAFGRHGSRLHRTSNSPSTR